MQRKQDRQDTIDWAIEILQKPGVLILDSETTDLEGEIIDLGITDLQGREVFQSFFKPSLPIHPKAAAVHKLTAASLADAPSWASKHDEIASLLSNAPLVLIYNEAFDYARIQQTAALYKQPKIIFDSACVMLAYAQYVGDWNNYRNSYRWQRLQGGDHSAIGDCKATLKVLQKMASGR